MCVVDVLRAACRCRQRRSHFWTRPIPSFVSIMPHFWLSYATVGRRTLVRTGAARGETGLTAFGDLMTFHAAIADGLLSRRRRGRLETVALVSAAVALALGVAAWVSAS